MNGLTATEAAERLGIPKTTLITWLSQLPVPHETDSRGRKKIGDEALAVLETVKSLRGEDCGYQTIRRRLEGVNEPERDGTDAEPFTPDHGRDANEPERNGPVQAPDVRELAGLVAAAVADVVKAENELAEKYARATYEVGELRATVRAKDERLELLAGELAELKADLAQARAQLAAPAARPWWKLWQ